MTAWTEAIDYVNNGEPDNAAVLGRPLRQLEDRTDYLKERLDAADTGQALIERDAAMEAGLAAGMACYWNEATGQFERALTGAAPDANGNLVPLASAYVLGVVQAKSSAVRGDVVLQGKAQLVPVLQDGSAPASGSYSLSGSVPGTLVNQLNRPVPTVPVLYYDAAAGFCYVAPYVKDFLNEHVHLRFELQARPCGTPLLGADDHFTILDPDAGLLGWLPADHAAFNGQAPPDAAFGYNLTLDPGLAAAWPPVPATAASFLLDRDGQGSVEVPLGPDGLVEFNAAGIWWKSSCVGDAPWPDNYTAPSSQSSTFPADPCPRPTRMRMYVAFSRMNYANDQHVVTSLTGDPDGTVQVISPQGRSAMRGDLELRLNQAMLGRYLPGVLQSRSGGASQALLQGLAYEALPAGQLSTEYWAIAVPAGGLPAGATLSLSLWLRGSLGGTLPALSVSVLVWPVPAVGAPQSPGSGFTPLTLATGLLVGPGQYGRFLAAPVPVRPGDLWLVQVQRPAVDGYAGEVGILRVEGVLAGA